jgi:exonuclease SbcD
VRIVHTSDWHAGRLWKGLSRLDELETVLDHLARHIERSGTDLLLVTGDVFDHAAPVPEAERIVFRFFRRVGDAGTETIVIAGNHDHPARMDAWSALAELVRVHTVTRPRRADQGGVIEIETKGGERAVIAALPFASVGDLVGAMELAGDETRARQRYADALRDMIASLARSFRPDAVNLLLAHTHLEGAILARSERAVHCSAEWAALPQSFPAEAHYVALGHIHKPQAIEGSPAPARYAGSPMQLDFGEMGQEKTFVSIEATPRLPAKIELVPYVGAKPLREVTSPLEDLAAEAPRLAGAWLRVIVPLDRPDPDLGAKVRAALPNAVDVRALLPPADATPSILAPPALTPRDEYASYVLAKRHKEAEPALLDAFDDLRRTCAEPGDGET